MSELTLIKKLTDCFGGTFVNRFHASTKTYENGKIKLSRSEGSLDNTIHSMFTEFEVMLKYVRQSGLQNLFDDPNDIVSSAARQHFIIL